MRQRSGKSARISEKNTYTKKDTNLPDNKTNDVPPDIKAIDKSNTSNSANEKIVQKDSEMLNLQSLKVKVISEDNYNETADNFDKIWNSHIVKKRKRRLSHLH